MILNGQNQDILYGINKTVCHHLSQLWVRKTGNNAGGCLYLDLGMSTVQD